MTRPPDVECTFAPVSMLTISEYWTQSSPAALHQEIARRVAEPRTKREVADALSRERLEFRSLWNGALVVNRLPNELLIHIFKFAMDLLGYWPEDLFYGKPLGTIATTFPTFWRHMRVCRQWREIIVGTPAFWSSVRIRQDNPVTNRRPWTELCLARSVAAPLDIGVDFYWRGLDEHLTIMRPLIHRVACLSFAVSHIPPQSEPDALASLPLLFGDGMPALKGLHFVLGYPSHPPYHLPVDVELTCRRFPRLCRIALAGVVAPQETSFYTQLLTLSLTTCSYKLSFDHFLDTLASCTRLQILRLDGVVDRVDGGDWMRRDLAAPLRSALISLPRLIKFTLSGHRAVCTARFLAYFHVPASTHLNISADAEDTDQPTAGPSPAGPRSMAAMLPPNHAITLEALAAARAVSMSMHDAEIHARGPAGSVFLKTRLIPGERPGDRAPQWQQPLRWASVTNLPRLLGSSFGVTSLWISHALPDTVVAWADVFRAFPQLVRLDVETLSFVAYRPETQNAFLGLHAASAGDSEEDPDCPDPGPVACPRLLYIGVHGWSSMAVYEAIRTCVRYRGDRGLVLKEVNIDISEWNLDHARCLACARDIVDCTERLRMQGLSLDENEEDEHSSALGASETEPNDQQDE